MARAVAGLFDRVIIFSNSYTNEFFNISSINYIKLYNIASRYHYIVALGMLIEPKLTSKLVSRMLHIDAEDIEKAVEKVGVIHVHWLVFSYLGKFLNMLTRRHIPVVVDLHGSFKLQTAPTNSPRDILAHIVGLLYERIGIKDKAIVAFTVPSFGFKEFMVRFYGVAPESMFVVPDIVEQEVIDTAKRCEETLVAFRDYKDCCDFYGYVAYAGSLTKFHGFFDLIKAVRIVRRRLGNSVRLLLIVPEAGQVMRVKSLLPEDTKILVGLPRRLVPCVLRGASVLVLPHPAGTQFDYIPSNKIYDYMLSGRPIVAYKTMAVVETLKKYPYAIFVKPNDPEALADGVIKAFELWRDVKLQEVDDVPTLDDAKKALERVYRYVLKW
jgi:glycosyltransferase involved in cell wall biosynthesis